MSKRRVGNNIFLVAKKSETKKRKLDYYLELPDGKREYAFTRDYSAICYMACKSGMPINDILYAKKKNGSFMKLVKYLNYMMPYFIEYYELDTEKKKKRTRCKEADILQVGNNTRELLMMF